MNSLQIRLKSLPNECHVLASETVHLSPKIKAMMLRETIYKCNDDYISTYRENSEMWVPCKKRNIDGGKIFILNEVSRQEICEWSFRVVDQFNGSRELVAIAQNYLDRFMESYCCNTKKYKLAGVTCLSLAVKVHHQKPISMKSLANLSRGEISVKDITEMESMILKNLNWKLCPPTASIFCSHFYVLLPSDIDQSVRQSILQQSCFFTELSLFKYSFALINQSEIAFAAILNAIEGLSSSLLSQKRRIRFIEDVEFYTGIDHTSDRVNITRDNLWILYRRTKQFSAKDKISKHINEIKK